MVLGTGNTRRGTAVSCDTIMTSAPVVYKNSFEDMLAEEANFTESHQTKHVTFLDMMGGGVTSSTRFWGCLVTMFGGCTRQSQASASSATTSSIESEVN